MTHADQKYIIALKENNVVLINEIYARFSEKILRYVLKNSGNEDEARDLFQESLMTIYDQAIHADLQLSCPFEAYFMLICRRKWLNKLRKNKKEVAKDDLGVYNNVEADKTYREKILIEQRLALLESKLDHLATGCKELLIQSWKGNGMELVADEMGFTYSYARKKKSKCIAQLIELVKNDSIFKELNLDGDF